MLSSCGPAGVPRHGFLATCKLCDLGQAAYPLLALLSSSVNRDDKNTHHTGLLCGSAEMLAVKMLCERQA